MDNRALLIMDDLAFLNARAMYPDAIVIPVSVQARIVATARAEALREARDQLKQLVRWACDTTKGEMFQIAKGAYVHIGNVEAILADRQEGEK